ncbi:hypothetical protein KCU87_g487, partial [Aureobasidium melanogenum]
LQRVTAEFPSLLRGATAGRQCPLGAAKMWWNPWSSADCIAALQGRLSSHASIAASALSHHSKHWSSIATLFRPTQSGINHLPIPSFEKIMEPFCANFRVVCEVASLFKTKDVRGHNIQSHSGKELIVSQISRSAGEACSDDLA